MIHSTLGTLPAPPSNRSGWPWIIGCDPFPPTAPDGKPWPKISIITPSYNQGQYLEETLRSVLLQGYPNLDYHVIDGGSTDESVEIIRKYEPWLTSWTSERDRGQSEAINKGFSRCSGDFVNWICSDDYFAQDALRMVARTFIEKPAVDVIAGSCLCQHDDDSAASVLKQADLMNWHLTPYVAGIWQPSCFFRRSKINRSFLVRNDLHYCMDRELWAYLCTQNTLWEGIDDTLSVYRFTGNNKSVLGKQKIVEELDEVYRCYVKESIPLPLLLRKCWLPLVLAYQEHPSSLRGLVSLGVSRGVALALLATYPRFRVRALQREFYSYSIW